MRWESFEIVQIFHFYFWSIQIEFPYPTWTGPANLRLSTEPFAESINNSTSPRATSVSAVNFCLESRQIFRVVKRNRDTSSNRRRLPRNFKLTSLVVLLHTRKLAMILWNLNEFMDTYRNKNMNSNSTSADRAHKATLCDSLRDSFAVLWKIHIDSWNSKVRTFWQL